MFFSKTLAFSLGVRDSVCALSCMASDMEPCEEVHRLFRKKV
jgi:hypothetical protein